MLKKFTGPLNIFFYTLRIIYIDLRINRMIQHNPSKVSLTNLLNDKLITKCISGFERQTKDCNYVCLRLRVRS